MPIQRYDGTTRQAVSPDGSGGHAIAVAFADRLDAINDQVAVALSDGAAYQPQQSNRNTGALITLTAASAGINGTDQLNVNHRAMLLFINVTAITGTTPTLTVTIQGRDKTSGQYYTILQSAAISATGLTVLRVSPNLASVANLVAQDLLPDTWRVITAIAGTTPAVTATIAASLVVA